MENILNLEYGIGGVCVLLTIQVLLKLGEYFLKVKEQKESLTDKSVKDLTKALQANTFALDHLKLRVDGFEKSMSELAKLKIDVRRSYAALKAIVGTEKWNQIRKEILEDDFNL